MRYVKLGKTELMVSECGFGCIPIIRLPKADTVKVLRHAFEKGITYFDTANAYRDSEEKIGMAFAGMRDKVVIATKSLMRRAERITDHVHSHELQNEKGSERGFQRGRTDRMLSAGRNVPGNGKRIMRP